MDILAFTRKLAIFGFYAAGGLVIMSVVLLHYAGFFISAVLMIANLYFWQLLDGKL